MNWLKGKKERIVIVISIALILCSFLMIPLSRKADNFPHDGWTNLIRIMTNAAGSGIAMAIVLNLFGRRSKQKCSISLDSKTNRLKKKAWGDFIKICITMILLLPGLGLVVFLNFEGNIKDLFPALPGIAFIVAITLYAKLRVKDLDVQNYLQFDEREFCLFRKSQEWGNFCFVVFISVAVMVVFLTAGSRGWVPVWTLPLALLSGLFLSGIVQFFFLMHHAKEED